MQELKMLSHTFRRTACNVELGFQVDPGKLYVELDWCRGRKLGVVRHLQRPSGVRPRNRCVSEQEGASVSPDRKVCWLASREPGLLLLRIVFFPGKITNFHQNVINHSWYPILPWRWIREIWRDRMWPVVLVLVRGGSQPSDKVDRKRTDFPRVDPGCSLDRAWIRVGSSRRRRDLGSAPSNCSPNRRLSSPRRPSKPLRRYASGMGVTRLKF